MFPLPVLFVQWGQMFHTLLPPPHSSALWLTESLDAIDRAESTGARVRVTVDLLREMGFAGVSIALRDASLNPTTVVETELSNGDSLTALALKPLPGAVWRRRLSHLERFRVGDLYVLEGSDPWVSREFFDANPQPADTGNSELRTDLLIALLRGPDGTLLGIATMVCVGDGCRPHEGLRCHIGAITRHLAARLAYDALRELAEQRHNRLLRVQDAGASLSRSLDEREIMRELARQVQLAVRVEGVAVLVPDLDADLLSTAFCVVRGTERTRTPVRLGDGLVAEVARSGSPVRVGDRDADRARERAGLTPPRSLYDVVGERGSATSVVAVPMRVGLRLLGVLAVHASAADVFTAEDEEVLCTMASQAATAMANARRYAEEGRRGFTARVSSRPTASKPASNING